MMIGVADAGDHIYDSAVFIQGGSFSNDPVPVIPAPGAFLLAGIGLAYSHLKMKRRREV